MIHRDSSLPNIHCTLARRAELIDFGALVPMGPDRQLVGTSVFTASEATHGLSLDARTDLLSLGAHSVLSRWRAGPPPFAARVFEDPREAWREPPRSPSELAPSIPAELGALMLGLPRVDLVHRPRSAFEVMQRLAAIPACSTTCSSPPKRRPAGAAPTARSSRSMRISRSG